MTNDTVKPTEGLGANAAVWTGSNRHPLMSQFRHVRWKGGSGEHRGEEEGLFLQRQFTQKSPDRCRANKTCIYINSGGENGVGRIGGILLL